MNLRGNLKVTQSNLNHEVTFKDLESLFFGKKRFSAISEKGNLNLRGDTLYSEKTGQTLKLPWLPSYLLYMGYQSYFGYFSLESSNNPETHQNPLKPRVTSTRTSQTKYRGEIDEK